MKDFLQNLDGKFKVATLAIFIILILALIADVTKLALLVVAIMTIVFAAILTLTKLQNETYKKIKQYLPIK